MKEHFFALIKEASTKGQVKAIVEAIDACHREDQSIFSEDDWPALSHAVARRVDELDLPF